jgi:Domain of unknown function (DUF1843)
MQKVAAYLMERRDETESLSSRQGEVERIRTAITSWLATKGVTQLAASGTYLPLDGSSGKYIVEEATNGDQNWWMVRLSEETSEGRKFVTSVSVTSVSGRISVFSTLETGWTRTLVAPVVVDPRCPRVVRDLLSLSGHWYHGLSRLRQLQLVEGFENGETLAEEIQHADRVVPIVVVSQRACKVVVPGLESKLAEDLAGLANVAVVNDEAAWALTDALGPEFSCYDGAVRLYWPKFAANRDRFFHPLWTADRLLSAGTPTSEAQDRLRKNLRRRVFDAAALSITRPREIDGIRDAVARRELSAALEQAAASNDYQQLEEVYAKANDRLREEQTKLRAQIESLESHVAKLEADRVSLKAHLDAKTSTSEKTTDPDEFAPDNGSVSVPAPPSPGDVRFYKKVHTQPHHDVMAPVADCGCNNWQNGHAGDKAKKGIAKLEGGRSNWRTLQHCASCTGGGVWRVKW